MKQLKLTLMSVCKKSAIEFCISLMLLPSPILLWRGSIVTISWHYCAGPLNASHQTRAISWEWNNYLRAEEWWLDSGSWEIYWSWHENSHAQWAVTQTLTLWHRSLTSDDSDIGPGPTITENIYTITRMELMSMSVSFRLNDPGLRRQL